MDRDGYQKIPRSFRKYGCRSFHEISVSKGGKKQTFCVDDTYVADLQAVDFDEVKKGLYAPICKRCGHMPCSVDALYLSGQRVYSRASFYQKNPDIGEGRVQLWGLGNLEGVLFSRVYTLSPDEFNSLAQRREWT